MTIAPSASVYGIVLAGGGSRRMGRDKALLDLGGRCFLAWTVGRMRPQCRRLAISRHDGVIDGFATDLPILSDGMPDRAGPLAGILAGLDWVARVDPGAAHAVSVPVDAPFLPADLVDRLGAAREAAGASACCAMSGGRRHPVAALWPVAAREALRDALLREGLRRVGQFLDRLAPAVAIWPTEPFDPFFNVNGPHDLGVSEEIARGLGPLP